MTKRSLHRGSTVPTTTPRALVAAGAGVVAVTYGLVRFGYGLHLPQLRAEFALSSALGGVVASGSFAAYCVTALVARRLVRRRGGRPVLRLAAALAAVGALVVAAAPSAAVLALGVLVAGSAAGAASPALVVAVAGSLPGPAQARAQAVVNAGTGAGVAVAGTWVLLAPGAWRAAWALSAVAAVLAAAAVDRRARWPAPDSGSTAHVAPGAPPAGGLGRPVVAAVLAGVGSAAVWTFGRELLDGEGGLPARTTAALWVVLGAAAVLGALSGDVVRVLGLRRAWGATVVLSAGATAVLALAPSAVALAAIAGAVFGASYTALSGVLIAWAADLRPHAAGATTATLFVALTAGQAVGAASTGVLAGRAGLPGAVLVGAAVLLAAVALAPRGGIRPAAPGSRPSPRGSTASA